MQQYLPEELLRSLDGVKGFDRAAFARVHLEGAKVTSVRWNPAKVGGGPPGNAWAGAERVPWSSMGYYLAERPSFTFDPLFHAGAYYVQEASSMFLEQALRQTVGLSRPLRVLDLCAAPGGKSTLIQSLLPEGSLLVSNEVIKTRVSVLQENMVKWGGDNVVVTNNDPRDFAKVENFFDVLVVDAPCSGSGLFRRDPDATAEWSLDNVELCHQRQQRILADCWPALKQEGILIYSTCSYSEAEDEAILDWMNGTWNVEGCSLETAPEWNIVACSGKKGGYGYRFYPDKLKGEGFFLCCVRKKDGGEFQYPRNRRNGLEKLSKQAEERVRPWIRPDSTIHFFGHKDLVWCLPDALREDLAFLQGQLYVKKAGVLAGKLVGDELIPEHELALSTLIRKELPALELSREEAIRYLRKEELRMDELKGAGEGLASESGRSVGGEGVDGLKKGPGGEVRAADGRILEGRKGEGRKGWMTVQYAGLNLGWVKVLPNRINNYYPKEWRILKRE